jgi:hypothetical protein
MYNDNGGEIVQHHTDAIASFGLRTTLESRPLGAVIADAIGDGISARSFNDPSSPSTGTWPVNSARYLKPVLSVICVHYACWQDR